MSRFPSDWRTIRMKEAATWLSGGTPSTSNPQYWGGSIPWISAASLKEFRVIDSERRVTSLGAAHGTRLIPEGTTIFVVRGMSLKTEFRVGITVREVAFGQDCKALIPASGIYPSFLAFAVAGQASAILKMVDEAGHGTGRLPTDQILDLPIGIPPMSEQKGIVSILEMADESIQSAERLIAKLEQAKHGIVDDLLTRGINESGQVRDPVRHPDQFVPTCIGLLPKAWPQVSIGQILVPPESLIQTGPFGSQLHANEYASEGTPVVMPQDIDPNGISTFRIARINPTKAAQLNRHRMQVGDIVLARRGDLSKCAAITSGQAGWLCGTGCLLLRPPARLSSSWLAAMYRHPICQSQIAATAVGTTMVNLNTKLVSGLQIPLPSSQEQQSISDVIAAEEAKVIQAKGEIEKLHLLKQGLMDDLLMGRVRVGASA